MNVNILILNWNSSQDISECLENIMKSTFLDYRIILIDNNSELEDKNKIIDLYHRYSNILNIHLVLNEANYGYAGGNNKGFEYIKKNQLDGDILILNPDVKIEENTIAEMLAMLHKNCGGVMVRTLKENSDILYDYIKLNGLLQKRMITHLDNVKTDYLAGSCFLIGQEVIKKLDNLFDDFFFMYWEEVDLSLRIKKLGFNICTTTKTVIVRKDNTEIRNINALFYYIRNSFYLQKKHSDVLKKHDLIIFLVFTLLSQMKQCGLKNCFYRISKIYKGFLEGIKLYFK